MSRSAGHLIVDTLENAGIERVYAVPGESYLDVLDGLYDANIETVVCRQEGGAAMMAAAHGQVTGRPGVAMVTRGPGATNASASAKIERTTFYIGSPLRMMPSPRLRRA